MNLFRICWSLLICKYVSTLEMTYSINDDIRNVINEEASNSAYIIDIFRINCTDVNNNVTLSLSPYNGPQGIISITIRPRNSDIGIEYHKTHAGYIAESMAINLTKSHAGIYTCSTLNQNYIKLDLRIKEPRAVSFRKKSTFCLINKNNNNNTENENICEFTKKTETAFEMSCSVKGDPEPKIQWFKDGENISEYADFSYEFDWSKTNLKIMKLEERHAGNYECVATNTINQQINKVHGQLRLKVIKYPNDKISTPVLIVSTLVVCILAIVVILLIRRIKKETRFKRALRRDIMTLFENGKIDEVNPNCGIDEQAELLPYEAKWEIPRSDILIGKQIGSGAYGRVVKAIVSDKKDKSSFNNNKTVAVKMCKTTMDISQVRSLAIELKILIHLGKHLNVVNLIGASTINIHKGELWILVEYCQFGNLLTFLHQHRSKFINQIDSVTDEINPFIINELNRDPFINHHNKTSENYSNLPINYKKIIGTQNGENVFVDFDNDGKISCLKDSGTAGSNFDYNGRDSGYNGTSKNGTGYNGMDSGNDGTSMSETGYNGTDSGYNGTSKNGTGYNGTDSGYNGTSKNGTGYNGTDSGYNGTSKNGIERHTAIMNNYKSISFKGDDKNKVNEASRIPGVTSPFTTSDLICWAWQVAQGMDYLTNRNILHGDLAARNLLLSDNNIVKISDFGLSRDIYKNQIYTKKNDCLLPMKWMSIEAIRDRIFSIQSDIWSYGIMFWELFTLGSMPYTNINISDKDFLSLLLNGYRMEKPKFANHQLYKIMLECWAEDPMKRPSFLDISQKLQCFMISTFTEEFEVLNNSYIKMNEEQFGEKTDYFKMFTTPHYDNIMTEQNSDEFNGCSTVYINLQSADNKEGTENHYLRMDSHGQTNTD